MWIQCVFLLHRVHLVISAIGSELLKCWNSGERRSKWVKWEETSQHSVSWGFADLYESGNKEKKGCIHKGLLFVNLYLQGINIHNVMARNSVKKFYPKHALEISIVEWYITVISLLLRLFHHSLLLLQTDLWKLNPCHCPNHIYRRALGFFFSSFVSFFPIFPLEFMLIAACRCIWRRIILDIMAHVCPNLFFIYPESSQWEAFPLPPGSPGN